MRHLACLKVCIVATSALLLGHPYAVAAPNLIFTNARIITVDRAFSIHQAIAIEGDRIARVGSDAEVSTLKGATTQVVDLAGRMVLPGLMDSHVHSARACLTEFDHPIPTMDTVADVLAYIRARAAALPEGQWIEVRQVFITRLKEQRYPTRAELDTAAPKHPVIFQTGPDASLNSLALQRSGIDRNFRVTDGGSGFIEKHPSTGEPTGILRNCTRYVRVQSPQRKAGAEDRASRLRELLRDYNASGLTAVCERDASPDDIAVYQALRGKNELTVRVALSHHIDSIGELKSIQSEIRRIAAHPLAKTNDPMLRIIGVKAYLDGGMLTGSAYMREPWGVSQIYNITDPAYRGVRFIEPERLRDMVRAAVEAELQFTAHSVGDGAVHALLDAYEEVDRDLPLRKTRPCISHSNFMSQEAVERAARLGVMVDIQPAWLYLDTHTLAKQFGYDRLRYFQPLRSLFAAGAIAGGGSDHMQKIGAERAINLYSPFLGMETAVTRKSRFYERALHPEEALSREQAIQYYTINNARILGLDSQTGSLEAGKLADFIVIDTDLLQCAPETISETKVLRTYVGGKLVHEASR